MLYWPPEIQAPERENYRFKGVDVTTRTPVGEGYVRTRRRAVGNPTSFEMTWHIDNDQARLLDDFYTDALRQGADAFIMPVWVHGAFHAHTVMFQERPQFDYATIFTERVTAKLTVTDRLARTLWYELKAGDEGSPVAVGTLPIDAVIDRVDLFIRTPANSDTTDVLIVGISGGDVDALVEATDIRDTEGAVYVNAAHAEGGIALGVTTYPADTVIEALWTATSSPTECDVLILVPYREP